MKNRSPIQVYKEFKQGKRCTRCGHTKYSHRKGPCDKKRQKCECKKFIKIKN